MIIIRCEYCGRFVRAHAGNQRWCSDPRCNVDRLAEKARQMRAGRRKWRIQNNVTSDNGRGFDMDIVFTNYRKMPLCEILLETGARIRSKATEKFAKYGYGGNRLLSLDAELRNITVKDKDLHIQYHIVLV